MTPRRLRSIPNGFEDLSEFMGAGPLGDVEQTADAPLAAWRLASSDADAAYAEWRHRPDRDSYARYRACADRADAAQDALAARAARNGSRPRQTKSECRRIRSHAVRSPRGCSPPR